MIYQPKKGHAPLRRRFAGVPPIARRVPLAQHQAVHRALDALFDDGQLEALRGFQSGSISAAEILAAQKKDRLTDSYLTQQVKLARPLFQQLTDAVQQLGESRKTVERYEWSIEKLRKVTGLTDTATLRALEKVKWRDLSRAWLGSASDWMRMRQMVGAALTVIMGDVFSTWRRQIMKAIPRKKEQPRVVELSPDEFWRLVAALPDQAKPGVVTLTVTGLRLGEYLSCRKEHLHAESLAVRNPSGKTGADVVYVPEAFWPWIEAAIPAPIQARWLRIHFHRARVTIGKPDLRLHDLRHVFGQLAADEGTAQSKIQAGMRHETAAMTARYLKRVAKREVAEAVGKGLTRGRKHA